jgi:TonB-dependent receptor
VIFPYLPRYSTKFGDRNRLSTLLDLQYRPTKNLEFNLVTLVEDSQRNYRTNDTDLFVRNSCNTTGTDSSCMIPVNVKADSEGYLVNGTFLNASWLFAPAVYRENVRFIDINPTVDWTVTPWLKIHGAIDYNDSFMNRRSWSFQFRTAPGMGYTATYSMNPGQDFPTMTTNAPVTDPTSTAWNWYRIQVQPVKRTTVGRATDWEATIGDETANIKVGYNYNQYYRYIFARDWSTNANNCFINGTSCTLPDGSVDTTGKYKITNAQLTQYLTSQPTGSFLGLSHGSQGFSGSLWNSAKLDDVTNIRAFVENAPFALNGALGAQRTGVVNEKTNNGFIEANATVKFLDHDIHLNGGVRYYNTDQKIVGPVLVSGNYVMTSVERTYEGFLPSLNISAEVYDNLMLRFAGSKTMTRPFPSAMLPGVAFSSALLSPVSVGNPNLQPYFSDNFDAGLEWYTGGPGVVAIDYFRKDISNFTQSQSIVEPFSATGIPLAALTATQLADYYLNGERNKAVTVNTTVNLQQKLHLEGWEMQVVQPLAFLFDGVGVTATYARITSHVDPGLTLSQAMGLATGVAPYAYSLGGYYENSDLSVHVIYNYAAKFISTATPSQQGIQQSQYTEAHGQLDLSASYTLPWLKETILDGAQMTFDATNLTSEHLRAYDGSTNAPNYVWYPGRAFIIGLRGRI